MEIVKEHIANKVSAPKLRFKEFNELMVKHEFSELVEKRSKTHNPINDNTNYKCIELESLSQETGILLNTFETKNLKSTKTKFKSGDVLFGKLRPYLKKFHVPKFDGVCTSEIWVLNGIKLQNKYLYQLIQTPKFNLEANITSGSKMPRADWNYISSIKYYTPSLLEQEKIASFLSAVDEKIQKLERKKSLLEEYKKGVMQKIFSQELRFKDDNGNNYPEWEMKKITSLAKTSIGLVTSMTKHYVKLGTPLIRNSDIVQNKIKKENLIYLDKDFDESNKGRRLYYKDIVTVHTGEIGVSAVIDNELNGCQGFATLNTRIYNQEIISSEYLCWYYNSTYNIKYAISMATGDGRSNYNLKDFNKAFIPVPHKYEQQKIASFLSGIDKKIELVETQIQQSKSFKKGLLQQMFV